MLSKDKRLNLKKDFSWVASGRQTSNNLFKLFFRSGDNQNPRVGIALSKANFKKAVDRNRARRLISIVFEALYDKLTKQINIVVLPKKEILDKSVAEISQELEQMLDKYHLL